MTTDQTQGTPCPTGLAGCLCDTRERHLVSECVVFGAATADIIHDDIRAILLALGLSDHARPYSMHAVVHRDILPAITDLRSAEIGR